MRIDYYLNPLRTKISLNEAEIETLKLKIKIDLYADIVFGFEYHLKENDPNEVLSYLNPHMNGKTHLQLALEELDGDIDKSTEDRLKYVLDDLQGYHVGDCTCVPCSCMKCYAESLLDINTIKGLGKHAAHHVQGVFGTDDSMTTLQAITKLKTQELEVYTGSEQNITRAIVWLEEYNNIYFAVKGEFE